MNVGFHLPLFTRRSLDEKDEHMFVEPRSSVSLLPRTSRRCDVAAWQQFIVSQLPSQSA